MGVTEITFIGTLAITYFPAGEAFRFTPLPEYFLAVIVAILLSYFALLEIVRNPSSRGTDLEHQLLK